MLTAIGWQTQLGILVGVLEVYPANHGPPKRNADIFFFFGQDWRKIGLRKLVWPTTIPGFPVSARSSIPQSKLGIWNCVSGIAIGPHKRHLRSHFETSSFLSNSRLGTVKRTK